MSVCLSFLSFAGAADVRTYASDLRRGLESTPKTKKPILQRETREKLEKNSDLETLETFADLETSQQPSPFDKLHDDIITNCKDSSEKWSQTECQMMEEEDEDEDEEDDRRHHHHRQI